VCFGVAVFFGEAKVDYVYLVAAFADAHEEVVGFDVAVDERLCMDVLDAGDLTKSTSIPQKHKTSNNGGGFRRGEGNVGEGRVRVGQRGEELFSERICDCKS